MLSEAFLSPNQQCVHTGLSEFLCKGSVICLIAVATFLSRARTMNCSHFGGYHMLFTMYRIMSSFKCCQPIYLFAFIFPK